MLYETIRFVLDAFKHFMPEEEVDDFVRGLVGKCVLLMPADNDYDHNCIEGFFQGVPCCHVSARKAPVLRELMKQLGRRSMVVRVESHNLERGFRTVLCKVTPTEPFSDDFLAEHLAKFEAWEYAGTSNVCTRRHRLLYANTDYLLERLGQEDATVEELAPTLEQYLRVLPLAFSREDKENCIRVNTRLQDSDAKGLRTYNARMVEAMDFLNHPELRVGLVTDWLEELMASKACQMEAKGLDADGVAARRANLRAFPDSLLDCYESDFATFCGNLFYNGIPEVKLQQFMNGIAVLELARRSVEGMALQAKKTPCVDVLATEEAMCLWAKAQRAGLVDEKFQPTMDSTRRASILAKIMGEKLQLSPLWEPFETLWNVKELANSYSQSMNCQYYSEVHDTVVDALK